MSLRNIQEFKGFNHITPKNATEPLPETKEKKFLFLKWEVKLMASANKGNTDLDFIYLNRMERSLRKMFRWIYQSSTDKRRIWKVIHSNSIVKENEPLPTTNVRNIFSQKIQSFFSSLPSSPTPSSLPPPTNKWTLLFTDPNRTDELKKELDKIADLNLPLPDTHHTPLTLALATLNLDITKYLLDKHTPPVDLFQKNGNEESPFAVFWKAEYAKRETIPYTQQTQTLQHMNQMNAFTNEFAHYAQINQAELNDKKTLKSLIDEIKEPYILGYVPFSDFLTFLSSKELISSLNNTPFCSLFATRQFPFNDIPPLT